MALKNPLKLMKEPVTTMEEVQQKRKDIKPWMIISGVLCLVGIGIFGLMYFGFLLFVLNKVEKKMELLVCDGCKKSIKFETIEEYKKLVKYTYTGPKAIFKGVTTICKDEGYTYDINASADASATVYITLKCPHCGEVKKYRYHINPFKCYIEQKGVHLVNLEIVKAKIEKLVKEVITEYNNPQTRNKIPYTIQSIHHPDYKEREKVHIKPITPIYNQVEIKYRRDIDEMVEGYFVHNEMNGDLVLDSISKPTEEQNKSESSETINIPAETYEQEEVLEKNETPVMMSSQQEHKTIEVPEEIVEEISYDEQMKRVQLLKGIKELYDLGVMSEEEYNTKKDELLKGIMSKKTPKTMEQQTVTPFTEAIVKHEEPEIENIVVNEEHHIQENQMVQESQIEEEIYLSETMVSKKGKIQKESKKKRPSQKNIAYAILMISHIIFILGFFTLAIFETNRFFLIYLYHPIQYFTAFGISIIVVVFEIILIIKLFGNNLTEKSNRTIFILMLVNLVVSLFMTVDTIYYLLSLKSDDIILPILTLIPVVIALVISIICIKFANRRAKRESWKNNKVFAYILTIVMIVITIGLHTYVLYDEKIYIDKSSQTIYGMNFFGKISKNIEIPEGAKKLATYAHFGSEDLDTLIIPNSLTYFEEFCFSNFYSNKIYYNGTLREWLNITYEYFGSNPFGYTEHFYLKDEKGVYYEVKNIKLPEHTYIKNFQFNGMKLDSIYIPESTSQYFGYMCFSSAKIKTIYFEGPESSYNLDGIDIPMDCELVFNYGKK